MLRAMRLSINIISTLSLRKRCIGGITRISNAVKEIGLGLDLKGGMNVTLQISVADVLKSLSNNNPDPNFNAAIAAAQAAQAGNNDFIVSFYNEYKKIDPNVRLSAIFSTFQLKDKITPRSTNDEVILNSSRRIE